MQFTVTGKEQLPRQRPGLLRIFTVLFFLISAFLPTQVTLPASEEPGKIATSFSHWLKQHPDEQVEVIVQQSDESVVELVHELDGQISTDLRLINGFSAILPALNVSILAESPGVRWISPNGPVNSTRKKNNDPIDGTKIINPYNEIIGAVDVWNEAPNYLRGEEVTVAIVDSGLAKKRDLGGRKVWNIDPKLIDHDEEEHEEEEHEVDEPKDHYGHGTFVASLIAGNGKHSDGRTFGVAPGINLLNVQVNGENGLTSEADVVEALQWLYEHREAYNVRVVNLSLNATTAQSYHTSPLSAAVEMLWFSGIVVVVSAGNEGNEQLYPPANDPRVITVGATDDQGTVDTADDVIAPYSSWGVDESGTVKPDLVAPGTNLVTYFPGNTQAKIAQEHQAHMLGKNYFRMSGTSMAAPLVTGAVALLLESEPDLTPDQVKYRLLISANRDWPGYDPYRAGAGYLDIYAAIHADTSAAANIGVAPSELLRPLLEAGLVTNSDGIIDWSQIDWSSVNWNSVNWNAIDWSAVNWNSVNWNAIDWSSVNWNSVGWTGVYWDDSEEITKEVMERTGLEDDSLQGAILYLPAIRSH